MITIPINFFCFSNLDSKMKIILISFVFSLILIGANGLKANSFCKMNQVKYIDYLEQDAGYLEKCVNLQCQSPFNYQCNRPYCSLDKKSCDQFKITVNLVKKINSTDSSILFYFFSLIN